MQRQQLNDVDELKRLIKDELRAILEAAERNRRSGTVASETEVSLDIKPYVPALDDRADARVGWYARVLDRLPTATADDRFGPGESASR